MAKHLDKIFAELWQSLHGARTDDLAPELARDLVKETLQHIGLRAEMLEPDQTDLLTRLAPLTARLAKHCTEEEFVESMMAGELPPIQLTDSEMRLLRLDGPRK